MKNSSITIMLAGILFGHAALAQERMQLQIEPVSPIYRDQILTIPNGTVIDEHGATHYRNIQLVSIGDNTFRLAYAEQGRLAEIDEVEIHVDPATETAEVIVTGALSSACVDVLEPVVSRKDNTFTVVLAETAPESDICVMMLVYYESEFELDTSELASGQYNVVVNGVEAGFTL